jgi:Protein of unknown function (DUF5656)
MRRREKFVITSILLSLGILAIQYINLDWRYLAIALFVLVSYFISAWSLNDDLQAHEWLTIVPFPSIYAAVVSMFYFLLPENWMTRIAIVVVFGVGLYGIFLTSNIFSVAKGRTIQLLYAAHAVGLFFTLLTSLLMTNTIFSLRLPFWSNGLLVGAAHFPIILMSLWSIRLEQAIGKEIVAYSLILSIFLQQFSVVLSFLPMAVWNASLFIMGFLYVSLGILHSYMRGRLFKNTLNEYSIVALFLIILFLVLFPLK